MPKRPLRLDARVQQPCAALPTWHNTCYAVAYWGATMCHTHQSLPCHKLLTMLFILMKLLTMLYMLNDSLTMLYILNDTFDHAVYSKDTLDHAVYISKSVVQGVEWGQQPCHHDALQLVDPLQC